MNRFIIFFCSMIFFFTVKGQSYIETINKGDEAFNSQQYKKAVDLYFAASAITPENKGEVKEKVQKVFDAIETLRTKAENAKKEALKQKEKASKQKDEALKQKEEASKQKEEALKQKEIADNAKKEADKQKAIAEKNYKELQELTKTSIGAKYEGGVVFAWKDPKGKSGLIVAENDWAGYHTWEEAMKEGPRVTINGYSGWRLPTIEELLILYANRNATGGFDLLEHSMPYWSSSIYTSGPETIVWDMFFTTGERRKDVNTQNQSVRFVRDYVRN